MNTVIALGKRSGCGVHLDNSCQVGPSIVLSVWRSDP
jgi:hypothetical protein